MSYTLSKRPDHLIVARLIVVPIMPLYKNDDVNATAGTLWLSDLDDYSNEMSDRSLVPQANRCGHFMYYQQAEGVRRLVGFRRGVELS